MAGIDKTYTSSYEEYISFVEWTKYKTITFYNGYKIRISNYIYEWDKESFNGRVLPIMNTPSWLDIYLIQNCPIKFVIDRMKDVYSSEDYKEFSKCEFPPKPNPEYKKNRKIVIRKTNKTKFPISNKPLYKNSKWWVQCDGWDYNEDCKTWVNNFDNLLPTWTNTMHIRTLKSAIRLLRKSYLPKGLVFIVSGRYIGEEFELITK